MNDTAPLGFTASRIAQCVGITKTRAFQVLGTVKPDAEILVNGNVAQAWSLPILPADLQARLESEAERQGYRNALHLLNTTDSPAPQIDGHAVSLAEIADCHIAKALKARRALQPILGSSDNSARPGLIAAAAVALATSQRHVRRLMERATQRDRGQRNFTRVELYLDDKLSRKARPEIQQRVTSHNLPAVLTEIVTHFECPENPTAEDIDELWLSILAYYKGLEADEPSAGARRQIIRRVLDNLLRAVPIGLSVRLDSCEKLFYSKLRRWEAGGCNSRAIEDRRHMASGHARRPAFAKDKEILTALAVQHGGNESLAQREAIRRGLLSQEYRDYYALDFRRNKSYVPSTIRADITPDVNIMEDFHHGPRQHILNRVHIPRDWSGVEPGDWFSADDVTWPLYWLTTDRNGEVVVTRGECLVMIDVRSGYILDYVLIAGKYNSRHIRKLQLHVHDMAGLPRKGNVFERGVWKARYLVGDGCPKKEHVHWRETERGMMEEGVICQIRHALLPRAKTIENLFGIFQNRMESEPGYIGRNEQIEKFERTQKNIRLARGGLLQAIKKLYTMEDWGRRLDSIFEEYNNEPQNGKMCPGISPAEAWKKGTDRQALRKLSLDNRFTLATNKRIVKVSKNGIRLEIGEDPFVYYNEHTAPLEGRHVLAWFNADYPEFITISDMERKNFRSVKRAFLPAMSATKDQFAEVKRQQAGHLNYARERYGEIKHHFLNTITRDNSHSPVNRALGGFINQQQEACAEERNHDGRQISKSYQLARELGQGLPETLENPEQYARSLQLEKEAEAEIRRLSETENEEGHK